MKSSLIFHPLVFRCLTGFCKVSGKEPSKMPPFDPGRAPLIGLVTNLGNGIFLRVPQYFSKLTGFAGHLNRL
jgi:hypothetical protein